MQKQKVALIAAIMAISISGCGSEEVVVEESVELRPIVTSITWEDMTIESFTPVTSMEATDSELSIFPYNNDERHITIRKIIISDNSFWDTVLSTVGDNNVIKKKEYSVITLSSGESYGYMEVGEDSAFIAYSADLPSSYVASSLEVLCSADT